LIYSSKLKKWYTPTDCVWADDRIQLPEKLSMRSEFKQCENLFLGVLEISKPNLKMHIKALLQKARAKANSGEILREIRNICALNPTIESVQPLENEKFLPVRFPSGYVELVGISQSFILADSREHEAIFKSKVAMLDFSLEEIHSIKGFLSLLRLENRNISKIVAEETSVEDGVLNQPLTDVFRRKAYAVCR
jgi:hypothetical protein